VPALESRVSDAPLTGALGGAHAERRFTGLRLRLPKLLHRADQRVYEVPAFGISLDKVHPGYRPVSNAKLAFVIFWQKGCLDLASASGAMQCEGTYDEPMPGLGSCESS
jgi:hypothetical protein